jgi:hypothetical protein
VERAGYSATVCQIPHRILGNEKILGGKMSYFDDPEEWEKQAKADRKEEAANAEVN